MIVNPKKTILLILYKCLFVIILIFQTNLSFSQQEKVPAINAHVQFINESIHGLLIAHRLLETFNQEVNKFVDLDSYQINYYGNNDLPQNIFEDPDHWFYEKSPHEWYEQCLLAQEKELKPYKSLLAGSTQKIFEIIESINQSRFDAENVLNSVDLTNRENLEKIYAVLENAVMLFENFYLEQKKFKKVLDQIIEKENIERNQKDIIRIHNTISTLLNDLRYKKDNDWKLKKDRLANLLEESKHPEFVNNKLQQFQRIAEQFYFTGDVATEYKLYGKYYYYHNSRLLNSVNRYGNGYVSSYNEELDFNRNIYLMEIPPFYQVVYPNRWMDEVPLISADPSIIEIPERVRDRRIEISENVIIVDKEIIEFELYDHQLVDGDIISVNFNGDWIVEKHPLKAKPYKLNIKLNTEGKNYLLLHAENLGSQPPNTMALKYTYRGEKKLYVLSSDMNQSELIEIRKF